MFEPKKWDGKPKGRPERSEWQKKNGKASLVEREASRILEEEMHRIRVEVAHQRLSQALGFPLPGTQNTDEF